MTLKALYGSGGFIPSIEFFPPRTPETEAKLLADLPAFKALNPSFCSVTMGAGGGTSAVDQTLNLLRVLKRDHGFETMCHFTCVGKSRDEVVRILGALRDIGVENLIALRGDPPKGAAQWKPHPEGFKHSVQLVEEVRRFGGMSVAVAGFPEVHPEAESPEADLAYLKAKVDAGADAVISQLFFDNGDFFRFADRARAAGIGVPIVPGVLPIRSVTWVRKFIPMIRARVPDALEKKLKACEGDEEATLAMGVEWATAQAAELRERGVPGVHFYGLNDPRGVGRVFRNLGLA